MTFITSLLYSTMSLLASIPVLHLLSTTLSLPILSFAARFLASVLALILCASYGVLASVVLRLSGYGGLSQWTVARAFKHTMRLLTGVTFTLTDPSSALTTRPAVFVGNHQSELDVLMLGTMFPPYCSVTAKAGLKYVPFLGWFMSLSKTVFINRANNREAREAFAGAVTTMQRDRQSVFIFPEGTRSYACSPSMLPFKKGAFHLAVQAGVPIVPVVTANYSRLLDVKGRVFRSGDVPISVLPAVETKGMGPEHVNALVERVRKSMEEELVRISERAMESGVTGEADKARAVAAALKSQ